MDALDLIRERDRLLADLKQAVKDYERRGRDLALAEYDYRTILRQVTLQLRTDGYPVTIINDLSRGNEDVAQKRLERDIRQASYEACRESINAVKLSLKIVEAQIARDWNDAGNF